MTVCVAAICENAMIWGASDRLIYDRSDDTASEPDIPKFRKVDNFAAVMFAGDTAIQSLIIDRLILRIAEKRHQEGRRQLRAEEVGNLYKLTHDDYHDSELKRNLDKRVKKSLQGAFSQLQAIIAGTDPPTAIYAHSPHRSASLYVFNGGILDSANDQGFAVIGIGDTEAKRLMRRAKHTPRASNQETQYLVYRAKKAAEDCPGVGKATDMFGLSILPNAFSPETTERLEFLEGVYQRQLEKERRAECEAKAEIWGRLRRALEEGDKKARVEDGNPEGA